MTTLKEALSRAINYDGVKVLTPDDDEFLRPVTDGIMVSVAGTIRVDMTGFGTGIDLVLSANVVYPFRIQRLYESGTDAEGIMGLYKTAYNR